VRIRNPVSLFLLLGCLVGLAIIGATQVLGMRAAQDEAIRDARSTTELLARSVAEPALPRGLVDGDPGALDRFDRTVLRRLVVGDVRRIKIWSGDGRIIYSDQVQLIGEQFALGDEERSVLADGGSRAEVSDLSKPENRFETGSGPLLEVYTRIQSPEGEPLLFEAYYTDEHIRTRTAAVLRPFRRIILGGLVALVTVASALLWGLNRRVAAAATERERLLQAAVDASAAERRRIARDLHDGVVQDLAGTAFSVSAMARDETEPGRRGALERAAGSLREGLRSLRSLLVEIHPPSLGPEGLAPALQDLVAPAAAQGLTAKVSVEGVSGVAEPTLGLVWRVAQEAVRNSMRHADAATLDLTVHRTGDHLVLEVRDDGRGFLPGERPDPTSFGLRGLESLVADLGGRLEVRSLPGRGTTVRLEVTTR